MFGENRENCLVKLNGILMKNDLKFWLNLLEF